MCSMQECKILRHFRRTEQRNLDLYTGRHIGARSVPCWNVKLCRPWIRRVTSGVPRAFDSSYDYTWRRRAASGMPRASHGGKGPNTPGNN
ncbi:Hypothetical predicted protein [Pelobates cultripes]|uniref:Uncharacterized protein n=1 Tax=Pelobates cultripes TaxID=61616 RepID=A0AAD1RID3_PELCU|nr:Hypothetical predicted protein [Pelobates cultripes]